jgi:hypothetical protein
VGLTIFYIISSTLNIFKTLYLASSGEEPLLGGGGGAKVTSAFQLATLFPVFHGNASFWANP